MMRELKLHLHFIRSGYCVRNSILSGVSSSANANKPLYDITSDANNVNVLIANSRLGAGTTGKVQVGQGSTITQNNII